MMHRAMIMLLAALMLLAGRTQAQDYALDAPERVHIRETLEVSWTAPQDTRGRLEIRASPEAASNANYAHAHRNPQAIMAPEAPGQYVLVYVFEGEVRASRPLSVFLPEASLEVPASVEAGADLDVVWSGPDSQSDNLTFAGRGGAPIRGASYAYTANTRGGAASLRAPADAGEYDVIYLSGGTILARAPITVESISATLSHAAQIPAGADVRVIWEGPRNAQDNITFAVRDGDPVRGASYAYVANAQDNAVRLRAPEQTGPLDIVYVASGRVIGRGPVEIVEARIDLEAPDEVTALGAFFAVWDGAGHRGDQISLVDDGGARLAFNYIRPDEPETRLAAPAQPGDFQLIYTTRDGREMARRPLRVLPAPEPPGTLLVDMAGSTLGPNDAVGVIFDASGSMLQRVDGVRRVEIARQTLAGLVSDTIPPGAGFALRVFGHRETGSCRSDLELPLGPLDPAAARRTINAINAMNLARTPLGDSIELAGGDLADVTGRRLLVVLTDGEETCNGDAAAAIEGLRARGWDITVNIVGFAIGDAALEAEFAAWADLGGGAYFSARDARSLGEALMQAVATGFSVRDAHDNEIAQGMPGEIMVLPAGDYVIVWGEDRRTPIAVPAGGAVQSTLE